MAEHHIRMVCNEFRDEETERRHDYNEQRDRDILAEHENKCRHNRDHAGEELRKSKQQAVRELIDIRDHTAHDVARLVRVEIRKRQNLHAADRLRADIPHDAISHTVIDHIHDPRRSRRENNQHENSRKIMRDNPEVNLSLRNNSIDRVSKENRHIELQDNGKCSQHDAERKKNSVSPDHVHNLPECGHGRCAVALHPDRFLRWDSCPVLLSFHHAFTSFKTDPCPAGAGLLSGNCE